MEQVQNCVVKLRSNPRRHRDKVYVGCGAGFGGDRPMAALKLLQRVKELNYLVLECLAERTLADRYRIMVSGGKGYDPRVKEWMSVLLPLALERKVCIITNMGAMDPLGAQKEVLNLASILGLEITVAVAYESSFETQGSPLSSFQSIGAGQGRSTYLGAASIVNCLENYKPNVVITSRVADAALFLAPMIYELGWNWNDTEELAQGTLASHLLECGCQLTGGYFMHPGDAYRDFSFEQLVDLSLPYAEVSYGGEVIVGKADGSGGLLSHSTCAEQLLYEVGDPANYITPDLVVDFCHVQFHQISKDKVHCEGAKPSDACRPEKLLQLSPTEGGWKGWGEISYGGHQCLKRAQAAEYLVRSWIGERYPDIDEKIVSYIMGYDSLKAVGGDKDSYSSKQVMDARLRMDGLFELEEHAVQFVEEFIALYTNGPAGGGGISTGQRKEIILQKMLVDRENIFWRAHAKKASIPCLQDQATDSETVQMHISQSQKNPTSRAMGIQHVDTSMGTAPPVRASPGKKIALYHIAHSRVGDKGNDMNFSVIPHFPGDIGRLMAVITPDWVKNVVSPLLDLSSFPDEQAIQRRINLLELVSVEIYEVPGICSLNVVVRNILDGGVNCSRRIDRHGKTLSDLILCQEVVLPP
ncbi:hypothetical protein SEVIR_2G130200v4 [Setaria viridis]|uniref:Uncharacterized protein n=2 Tax=Setaria TaxID=4554 RepID=K3ZRG1_SETIT|nr:uncharacterized protein LOC101764660 isoform X2 [Setaria italica]XP_034578382.1 uncharacterized protein LOC117842133 isoform X2 [Setaria viridis]RCV10640.1 hypothetical protein SETIT_2G125300v2 [Setaria italica]TKW31805.1 hypothetical protein SEVIR_2G130200v2 [Setaria viridis]TKW31807.1 hypothetical protein SEVIR_2G130200v2 [Setaria viridis]